MRWTRFFASGASAIKRLEDLMTRARKRGAALGAGAPSRSATIIIFPGAASSSLRRKRACPRTTGEGPPVRKWNGWQH